MDTIYIKPYLIPNMEPKQFGYVGILILVLAAILIAPNLIIPENQDEGSVYPIYDVHEHLAEGNLEKLLFAMEENNISFTAVLGSPKYTLTLRDPGFEEHGRNNDFLIEASKSNPILVFCTIDPREEDSIETLKDCMERGATGLKLYSGHKSSFYSFLGPLDRKEVLPVYKYCEDNNIPIMFHVNPYYENIRNEFENILNNYTNLVVDCPHWCLSSINDERFNDMYSEHTNLYTDISFGSRFAQDGFERVSENPERHRKLVEDYQDRFMFGADMVLTNVKSKEFARDMLACYKKMLEEEHYECDVEAASPEFSVHGNFTGLNLSEEILRKIYFENPKRFLEGKPPVS